MPKGEPKKMCLYAQKIMSESIMACKHILRGRLHCSQDRPPEINHVYISGGLEGNMGRRKSKINGMVVVRE